MENKRFLFKFLQSLQIYSHDQEWYPVSLSFSNELLQLIEGGLTWCLILPKGINGLKKSWKWSRSWMKMKNLSTVWRSILNLWMLNWMLKRKIIMKLKRIAKSWVSSSERESQTTRETFSNIIFLLILTAIHFSFHFWFYLQHFVYRKSLCRNRLNDKKFHNFQRGLRQRL